MSFKGGIGNAAGDVFGEGSLELPWMLLSECDSIEGFLFLVILALVFYAVIAILLGLVTAVSESFTRGGFQGLGLK